jgi:8-amino-7-oxononanoate synthase
MTEVPTDAWSDWFDAQTTAIHEAGRWRSPRSFDAKGPVGSLEGREVVSFASNDYLGLTHHPAVQAAAIDAIERWGTGSGASRLIVGSRPVHHDLEDAIAAWRGTGAAVIFPTGFAANLGLLATLGAPGVRIVSDELNHASIIDGCRMARVNGAEIIVHRHLDLDHLEKELAHPGCERRVVVADSVFSMDGDLAPVERLVEICDRHDSLLVLDEAHSVLQPLPDPADHDVTIIQVGTLSKTVGSLGGFVAAPRTVVDLLVNRARSYIFTTAPSPADTAAALTAIGIVCSAEGDRLRERLRALVERVRPGHGSPIIPVVLGEERTALYAARLMLDRGLFVPAIRPPTVPVGTSRLRVALSAAHSDSQIDALIGALRDLEPDMAGDGT